MNHLAILGAGPGGYVAAIRAAQLGARVTVEIFPNVGHGVDARVAGRVKALVV